MTNIYYLHHCARTSASWLNDSLVARSMLSSFRTLSVASHLVRLHGSVSLPFSPMFQVDEFYLKWCLQSVWQTQWLLAYYETLAEIRTNVFKVKHTIFNSSKELHESLEFFPDNGYRAPIEPQVERDLYALNRSVGSYRRIQPPFWLRASRIRALEPPPIDLEEDEKSLDSQE